MSKLDSDKVKIGDMEFTVTKDSFKLVEIDYELAKQSCEVCNLGKYCEYKYQLGVKQYMLISMCKILQISPEIIREDDILNQFL